MFLAINKSWWKWHYSGR